mmetsp:Transcript_18458/g.37458  ORF Transcript_18458/g.37458 Transcript_18458/m.37458 type:complete len:404 (-) Transcript_18458:1041-2252(-)
MASSNLINLLHGTFFIVVIIQCWQIIHIIIHFAFIIIINTQSQLNQPVNPTGKGARLIQTESTGQEGSIIQQPDQIFDSLIGLIGISLLAECSDNRVLGVDLHSLLGGHVGRLGRIAESLRFHDAFHVGGPTVFSGDKTAWRVGEAVGHDDLFDLIVEDFLHELAQSFGLGFGFFERLLFVFVLNHLESLLGGTDEFLALELLQLLDSVFVDGINHVEDFVSLLLEFLEEGRSFDGTFGFSSDVIDARLLVVHAADVIIETSHGVSALGRMVTEEFGEFGAVGRIFMDAQLEVLRERLVEFVVGVFIFSEVVKHFDALLDQILLDDTKNLVLLKGFTRNVERKILRIDNSLDEGQPLGHQILAVVHDEYATDIQLNVVVLLLGSSLEHVEGGTLGAEEHGLKF